MCTTYLYHTECGISNMYHVADLLQLFDQGSFTAIKECFCSILLSDCFSMNAECSMSDLEC